MQGTVKWFDEVKGYGFIDVEGMEKNVFIHHSNIKMDGFKTLNEGDEVEFEPEQTNKGQQAINLIVTKSAPKKEKVKAKENDL